MLLQVFHHLVTIGAYGVVCMKRCVRLCRNGVGGLRRAGLAAHPKWLTPWSVSDAMCLGCFVSATSVGGSLLNGCRRMSWYACALIMLESTTPFGNFRYLMSKSDSPVTGKNSVLYGINAAAWVVSFQSVVLGCGVWVGLEGRADVNLMRRCMLQIMFFLVRVCTIPILLSCGYRDATNLLRSITVTRSDRLVFFSLLGSYLAMCPLNVFWFSKMVRGAVKLLKGQDPEAEGAQQ